MSDLPAFELPPEPPVVAVLRAAFLGSLEARWLKVSLDPLARLKAWGQWTGAFVAAASAAHPGADRHVWFMAPRMAIRAAVRDPVIASALLGEKAWPSGAEDAPLATESKRAFVQALVGVASFNEEQRRALIEGVAGQSPSQPKPSESNQVWEEQAKRWASLAGGFEGYEASRGELIQQCSVSCESALVKAFESFEVEMAQMRQHMGGSEGCREALLSSMADKLPGAMSRYRNTSHPFSKVFAGDLIDRLASTAMLSELHGGADGRAIAIQAIECLELCHAELPNQMGKDDAVEMAAAFRRASLPWLGAVESGGVNKGLAARLAMLAWEASAPRPEEGRAVNCPREERFQAIEAWREVCIERLGDELAAARPSSPGDSGSFVSNPMERAIAREIFIRKGGFARECLALLAGGAAPPERCLVMGASVGALAPLAQAGRPRAVEACAFMKAGLARLRAELIERGHLSHWISIDTAITEAAGVAWARPLTPREASPEGPIDLVVEQLMRQNLPCAAPAELREALAEALISSRLKGLALLERQALEEAIEGRSGTEESQGRASRL